MSMTRQQINSLTRGQLLRMQSSARIYQARADSVFEAWGFRAPQPTLGQDPQDYRRDLCVMAKRQLPHGHELRKLKLWKMDNYVFEKFEPQIYSACKEAASRPDSVPPGEMRMIKTKNPDNGQEIITFIGRTSFVKDMGRPGRRVTSFLHQYDGSGRPLR